MAEQNFIYIEWDLILKHSLFVNKWSNIKDRLKLKSIYKYLALFDVDAWRLITVVKLWIVRNFPDSCTKPKSDAFHLLRFKLFFS